MFKGRFKTADGKVHEMAGPTKWLEMTTETFERLFSEWKDKEDLTKLMSIMYGVDYDILLTANPKLIEPLATALRFFVNEEPVFKSNPIMVSKLDGMDVPTRIGNQAFGKAIMLKAMLAKPFEENVSLMVAIWMLDGKFDMNKARELQVKIKQLPIEYTYPVAFFCTSTLTLPGYVLTIVSLLKRLQAMTSGLRFHSLLIQVNSILTSISSRPMPKSLD